MPQAARSEGAGFGEKAGAFCPVTTRNPGQVPALTRIAPGIGVPIAAAGLLLALLRRPRGRMALSLVLLCGQVRAQNRTAQGPMLLTLQGRGVQVYRCEAMGSAAAWVPDHPEADLLDARRKIIGHHDAGPRWQLDDGSAVKGEVVENEVASEPRAIPWLLVRATSHEGAGLLSGVETIRRVETHGGMAPTQGCDGAMAGATVRVPYTATYLFFGKP